MSDKYKSAFPVHPEVSLVNEPQWCGMTLRDYFAGKAMQGMLANAGPYDPKWKKGDTEYQHTQLIANLSYFYADVMMEARDGQA